MVIKVVVCRALRKLLQTIGIIIGHFTSRYDRWEVDFVNAAKTMTARNEGYLDESQTLLVGLA